MITTTAIALALTFAAQGGEDLVGGVRYERLGTRQATLESMRAKLQPRRAVWGEWWQLGPFDYDGHGNLHVPTAFEDQLERLELGGPGPDLERTWTGKRDTELTWRNLGVIDGRKHDLHRGEDDELNDYVVAYLYTRVRCPAPIDLPITCGSDDGIRMWLNGELLLDHDVPRGLSPDAERLSLPLRAGDNHLLVKISEGEGGWDFQINVRKPLPASVDAELKHRLDVDFPPAPEWQHWRAYTVPVPADVVLEVGGLDFLSDGTPIVCTRRGDVYRVVDADASPPRDARLELFASGLHEPLGLAVRSEDGRDVVYCSQRGEVTRLVDEDGDGRADLYGAFFDGWGVSGNYHEFAFGPKFHSNGDAWVTLNVGFCGSLGKSIVPWRGWALRIAPDGTMTPVCDGLRSPNGIGEWVDGSVFYLDNQGDYVATNRLSHLSPGSWHGHPASLKWRDDLASPDDRPPRKPAAVWIPYERMGQSAADLDLCRADGRFGPFDGQFFSGDQTYASVLRISLELVEGEYQGACYPFFSELDCGVNRVAFAPNGSLWVGQTDRGWGSVGRKTNGIQRIDFLGEAPFELREVRATTDGFELEFTDVVEPISAADPRSYRCESWTYEYHAAYGAPEDERARVDVVSAVIVDEFTVRLRCEPLRAGFVHKLDAASVRSNEGAEPLHGEAYYTLQRIPGRVAEEVAEERPRVLFLTQSAGFEHGVVKRPRPGIFAHAEERLIEAASGRFDVTATQDCSALAGERLDGWDAIVLYTTGELPLDPADRVALLAWLRAGGALVGVHCATDTWYEWPEYMELIGGAFDGHPWNRKVRVVVEDPSHPAVAHLGEGFEITDEIYQFRDFRRHPTRVLLSLDGDSVDVEKGKRVDGDYALAWHRAYGEGRLFYTALGHRNAVWTDERFLAHLLDGIDWTLTGADDRPAPPAGATALLADGMNAFARRGGGEAGWQTVGDGAHEVVAGAGDIVSREHFGDALIHVEFRTPLEPDTDRGQARGNSGVYVQGRYEVQVLDSFGLESQLGDCAAIYGVKVPDTNACREPERWQTYDIEFRAPRFGAAGEKVESARMSVWHNGVPVHVDVPVDGPTVGGLSGEGPRGPLLLQDHGDAVRYRNVWVLPRD